MRYVAWMRNKVPDAGSRFPTGLSDATGDMDGDITVVTPRKLNKLSISLQSQNLGVQGFFLGNWDILIM